MHNYLGEEKTRVSGPEVEAYIGYLRENNAAHLAEAHNLYIAFDWCVLGLFQNIKLFLCFIFIFLA